MDEKDLIEKIKEGDKNAFEEIYKKYLQKIYRYCSFQVKDKVLAEDICQETFVKAYKSIKKFKLKENWSLQAYLFTIARNLVIDNSRKKKAVPIDKYEFLESKENLFEEITRQENTVKIKKALMQLEETERQIVILKYFEDMGSKEIAEILNMKDGAIRVRVHRIMDKLKLIVENYDKSN